MLASAALWLTTTVAGAHAVDVPGAAPAAATGAAAKVAPTATSSSS